jgi:3-dehydroquinate synthase
MTNFTVDNIKLETLDKYTDSLEIVSTPKNYNVFFKKFEYTFNEHDFLLIDNNIQAIYGICHKNQFILDATESNKNIDSTLKVCEWLCGKKFNKGHRLYVIGGGITQDIGAFVGSIYKRGINWIYVPTTLLSQCDSCIGGKTALNFHGAKNQLALFSAPSSVIIDTGFLDSLSQQDIINGMGEIIKFFIIGGENYLQNLDTYTRQEQIFHSLSIKKSVIEYDEFELNIRKCLNYGHSFGHAIEAATDYNIPHGEAVLLGIEIINKIFIKNDDISNIIYKYTSLDKIKNIKASTILNLLKEDKKTQLDQISFVVTERPGITNFIKVQLNELFIETLYEIFTN